MICKRCGEDKPLTNEFFRATDKRLSGFMGICIDCEREKRRIHNQKHKEYRNEYYKKYNKEHRQERKKYYKHRNKVKNHNRRTRKRSSEHTLTKAQWQKTLDYFNNSCAYCGSTENLTQEHFIPISKNGHHTINNVIPACDRCNLNKSNHDFEDWYPRQEFYSEKRAENILKYLGGDQID